MFVRPEEKHLSGRRHSRYVVDGHRFSWPSASGGMQALGYHQVAVNMVPGQEDDMLERWAAVMAEVECLPIRP